MAETSAEAAKRISQLPTFEERRRAANEYTAANPQPNIYSFYRLINEALGHEY